jgi:hypothetical protein
MIETKSSVAEHFSITRGEPLHWLLVRFGHVSDERERVIARALVAVLFTWLPLLVLSLAQGQAYGTQVKIPFLRDIAVNVRFLIAVPILILAESVVDQRWRILISAISQGCIGKREGASRFRGGDRGPPSIPVCRADWLAQWADCRAYSAWRKSLLEPSRYS